MRDARTHSRRPIRRGRPARFVGLALLALVPAGACREGGTPPTPAVEPADPPTAAAPAWFTEITERIGVGHPDEPWPDGTFFMPEVMGPGVALLDFDNDGALDILRVCAPPPGAASEPASNRLYRQQPDGTFVDVTDTSGLGDPGYGQGVAVGDTDNDGDLDVFFANFGPDAYYENNGDGTFVERTAAAGIRDDAWGSSATFCDYDRDGDLDLYVANYLRYEHRGACLDADSHEIFCGPIYFDGVPDRLYRNDGGRFTDVTLAAGIRLPDGGRAAKGLGVICADLTRDDLPDFFVANDGELNQLWVNRGDGTFSEEGIMRGVAVNGDGQPEASMGVTLGDVDGDGYLDLFMTHLAQENNRLYAGGPRATLVDRSVESRLSRYDLATTGFGCGFLDFDNDGDLDLAVVNGRVYGDRPVPGARLGPFWDRYAEPNFLFENDGSGRFDDVSERAGTFASTVGVSRGLALGDLDNDGDVDLVLSEYDTSVHVYRNDAPRAGRHWLTIRALVGPRDAIGARITVSAGGRTFVTTILPGYSYQSSSDPRAHVGLGSIDRVERIEVVWPDGSRETFEAPGVDRELTLRRRGSVS